MGLKSQCVTNPFLVIYSLLLEKLDRMAMLVDVHSSIFSQLLLSKFHMLYTTTFAIWSYLCQVAYY